MTDSPSPTEAAHTALADLAMQAIDTLTEKREEEDAELELVSAVLVFEVRVRRGDDDPKYRGCWKALPDSSPFHLAGLMNACAANLYDG